MPSCVRVTSLLGWNESLSCWRVHDFCYWEATFALRGDRFFGPRKPPTETANERCGMCRAVVKAKLSDHTIVQSGNDANSIGWLLLSPKKKIDPRGSTHGGRSMNGKSKVWKKETTFPPPLSCRHSCFLFTGSVTKGLSSARCIDRAHTCSHL